MRLRNGMIAIVMLFLFVSPSWAADIEIEENPIPANSFGVAKYKLEKGDAVIWDITPKPTKMKEFTVDGYSYVHFSGPTDKYTIVAIVINFDTRKFERKRLEGVGLTGCAAAAPPKKDPDPVLPTDSLYFLVIRADGPAHPSFTKIMSSPAWDGLRSQGHKVRDVDLTGSRNLNINLDGATLPVVVTLKVSPDGKKSTQVRGPVPLPATAEQIAKLPELK